MDSRGVIYTTEEAKSKFKEEFENAVMAIPQKDLEDVVKMNRQQRRAWYRDQKKRGKGYTK